MNYTTKKLLPISCICSVYYRTNVYEFIIAIDSLLIQNYIPNEIVILVDGKIKEDLRSFLKLLVSEKELFKIYYISKNIGLGSALRYGLPKCRNELIARFDSDDINLKNRLKIQYDYLKKNPDISILGSNVIEFKKIDGDLILKKMPINSNNLFKNYMVRNPLNHPSILFRKKDILKVGSYKEIKFFEDYELWLRCIKGGLLFYNLDKSLVAMKRSSFLANRSGYNYAIAELRFLKETIKQKTIQKIFIPYYFIRILIRLLPFKNFSFLKKFDSRRIDIKESLNLKDYILKLTKDTKSFSYKFTKNNI